MASFSLVASAWKSTRVNRGLSPRRSLSAVRNTPDQTERLYAAGADVVTLGNHTFGKPQLAARLEEDPYLLRPANYTGQRSRRDPSCPDR